MIKEELAEMGYKPSNVQVILSDETSGLLYLVNDGIYY